MSKLLLFGLLVLLAMIKDVPNMVFQAQWKELITYLALLSLGSVLTVLQILGVNIPSPIILLQFLLGPYN